MTHTIARVVLPVPLDKAFDYAIPDNMNPVVGGRVWVPFGPHKKIAVVVGLTNETDVPVGKIKPIKGVIDLQPLWSNDVFSLLKWACQYYQYPLGNGLANAMPPLLRKGESADITQMVRHYTVNDSPTIQLRITQKKLSTIQQALVEFFRQDPNKTQHVTAIKTQKLSISALMSLKKYGIVESLENDEFKLIHDTPYIETQEKKPLTKQQTEVMDFLEQQPNKSAVEHTLIEQGYSLSCIKRLVGNTQLRLTESAPVWIDWVNEFAITEEKPTPSEEQKNAIEAINQIHGFQCSLLDGITGSGKTEVYLNILEPVLKAGKQALILVPEIGLTPQTINRFRRRFGNTPLYALNSSIDDVDRLKAWMLAKENQLGIIIGTRSALFTPFHNLGIIIIDEEHDLSYKQQETLRYHARDLAIMRAYENKIPIVLGSATPALETLHNAFQGKYQHLKLTHRPGNAKAPKNGVIDLKSLTLQAGLSQPLLDEMHRHLERGNQVMLFLNRRGYAPTIMCHECGWIADCPKCNAHYTFHQHARQVRCHHCDDRRPIMHQCGGCGSTQLITVGVGTEQLETQLSELFPAYKTVRIDRDSTRKKGSLDSLLSGIKKGEYQILIGTQMLAKGHHFPNVTLVGILNVDGALFSLDFRAPERLAQLFVQVSGRAGRAEKPGKVLLQSHHPEHPLLQSMLKYGYPTFAEETLVERKEMDLPPYSFLALFRASYHNEQSILQLLQGVKTELERMNKGQEGVFIMGPTPAPLAKKSNAYRYQLLLQAPNRKLLQGLLMVAKSFLENTPLAQKIAWSIDVEPVDLF